MPTINQLIKHGRERRTEKSKTPIMLSARRSAACAFPFPPPLPKSRTPALRKIARVRLTNKQEGTVYIPGEGHNLNEHSSVLIRGGPCA